MDSSPAASIISAIYPCHTPARPRSCNADILTCYGGYRWVISYVTCPVAPADRTWSTGHTGFILISYATCPVALADRTRTSLVMRPVLLHLLTGPGPKGIQDSASLVMRPVLLHLLTGPGAQGIQEAPHWLCDLSCHTCRQDQYLISYATCPVTPADRTSTSLAMRPVLLHLLTGPGAQGIQEAPHWLCDLSCHTCRQDQYLISYATCPVTPADRTSTSLAMRPVLSHLPTGPVPH